MRRSSAWILRGPITKTLNEVSQELRLDFQGRNYAYRFGEPTDIELRNELKIPSPASRPASANTPVRLLCGATCVCLLSALDRSAKLTAAGLSLGPNRQLTELCLKKSWCRVSCKLTSDAPIHFGGAWMEARGAAFARRLPLPPSPLAPAVYDHCISRSALCGPGEASSRKLSTLCQIINPSSITTQWNLIKKKFETKLSIAA